MDTSGPGAADSVDTKKTPAPASSPATPAKKSLPAPRAAQEALALIRTVLDCADSVNEHADGHGTGQTPSTTSSDSIDTVPTKQSSEVTTDADSAPTRSYHTTGVGAKAAALGFSLVSLSHHPFRAPHERLRKDLATMKSLCVDANGAGWGTEAFVWVLQLGTELLARGSDMLGYFFARMVRRNMTNLEAAVFEGLPDDQQLISCVEVDEENVAEKDNETTEIRETSRRFNRVELREGMLRVLCHVAQLSGRHMDLVLFCQHVWPALIAYISKVESKGSQVTLLRGVFVILCSPELKWPVDAQEAVKGVKMALSLCVDDDVSVPSLAIENLWRLIKTIFSKSRAASRPAAPAPAAQNPNARVRRHAGSSVSVLLSYVVAAQEFTKQNFGTLRADAALGNESDEIGIVGGGGDGVGAPPTMRDERQLLRKLILNGREVEAQRLLQVCKPGSLKYALDDPNDRTRVSATLLLWHQLCLLSRQKDMKRNEFRQRFLDLVDVMLRLQDLRRPSTAQAAAGVCLCSCMNANDKSCSSLIEKSSPNPISSADHTLSASGASCHRALLS